MPDRQSSQSGVNETQEHLRKKKTTPKNKTKKTKQIKIPATISYMRDLIGSLQLYTQYFSNLFM